jgi:hypothetical protein
MGHGFFPETQELASRVKEQFSRMRSWQAVLSLAEETGFRIHCWRREASWRQEWISRTNGTASVVRAALGHGQRLIASYPSAFTFPLSPLRLAGRDDPLALWRSLGVETEIKSYQFFSHRPCIVLGATFGNLDRPQVWIDLEEHVPLRLVSASGLQWIWKDYYRAGNVALPHSLTVVLPGGERLTMEIVWKGVNTDIPDPLFDVSAFRDKFGRAPFTQLPSQRMQLLWERLPKARR